MEELLGVPVTATASIDQAVADAEIVILATTSTTPVLTAKSLLPSAHVTTDGPKFFDNHELDAQRVDAVWTIATDSPQQIQAHGDRFFVQNTTTRERIGHLGATDVRNTDRPGRTVYLSAGLAGTEVLVAHALIDQQDPRR